MPRAGLVLCAVLALFAGCTDDEAACPGACDAAGEAAPETAQADGEGAEGSDAAPDADIVRAPSGPRAKMDFARRAGLFDAPVPSADLRRADGRPDLSAWPNPSGTKMIDQLLTLLGRDADGFARTATIYLPIDRDGSSTTGDVGGSEGLRDLPTLDESVSPDAAVQLIDVDDRSPERGRRIPVRTAFLADGGPFGARDLLAILPLQGIPLRAETRYAAVATRALRDHAGERLRSAPALKTLLEGGAPEGLADAALADYRGALDALDAIGLPPNSLASLAVFRTGAPGRGLRTAREAALARPPPTPLEGWALIDAFEDYCVFRSSVDLPVYQRGDPPYLDGVGGDWITGDDGAPILQRMARSRLFVTVPRQPSPAEGYPLALFLRTGGGGDRPLVDRGIRDAQGDAAPGDGLARDLARRGVAGLTFDGPHGGPRNVSGTDEQLLIFNISNPAAMRDNIRQTALEAVLIAQLSDDLSIPTEGCAGAGGEAGSARFDARRLSLFGHSMGATIAPLALAVEPRFVAAALSGAGGSWIDNVVYKRSPVHVRPLAEGLLGYARSRRTLDVFDPALMLLQWAGEAADPPVYGADQLIRAAPEQAPAPRHLLVIQGIVDTYIFPPIANALALSGGLDLAGPALDASHPDLAGFEALAEVLPLVGRGVVTLPARANRAITGADAATAVVVQHPEDGVEDGHEALFQQGAARRQVACFLAAAGAGTPTVPAPAPRFSPCAP